MNPLVLEWAHRKVILAVMPCVDQPLMIRVTCESLILGEVIAITNPNVIVLTV